MFRLMREPTAPVDQTFRDWLMAMARVMDLRAVLGAGAGQKL